MGFELYERDGHSKRKVFESDELEEIARVSAEMSGKDYDSLFRLGESDD